MDEMKEGQLIRFKKPKEYEFIRQLTPGGTGKTVLMRDMTINELFVCKKFDPTQKEYEEEFFLRFVDEIKIMYSVFNNHVVRIFDYYLYPEKRTGYIIMEYIQGKNIGEYFMNEENEEKINSVFVQLIDAFAYLEKKGILHRDIREANIIIDDNDVLKVIDFGFGKKLYCDDKNIEASIILNWPVSRIPEDILNEIYSERTEIFYVGYLIKNLIKKYSIRSFMYNNLLDKMTQETLNKRIGSFEEIQNSIVEQNFADIQFSDRQKEIYRTFSLNVYSSLKEIKDKLLVEKDSSIIAEKLKELLKKNVLEKYISNVRDLLAVFIKSGYVYRNMQIDVQCVEEFYTFFVSLSEEQKGIVLDNLYGKLTNIRIVQSIFDEELPFN